DRALAASLGAGARAGTPREAAAFGEVVMVSVPYRALPAVGKDAGDLLEGKVVIDTCNPFPGRDGEIAEWAKDKGAGLASAELLPGARLVRAFNAIGAERMGLAHEEPGRIGMPIASDDAEAAEVASQLIREIGYEPVLIGGLDKGRFLVPGTSLAGERSAEEIRQIAAELESELLSLSPARPHAPRAAAQVRTRAYRGPTGRNRPPPRRWSAGTA